MALLRKPVQCYLEGRKGSNRYFRPQNIQYLLRALLGPKYICYMGTWSLWEINATTFGV